MRKLFPLLFLFSSVFSASINIEYKPPIAIVGHHFDVKVIPKQDIWSENIYWKVCAWLIKNSNVVDGTCTEPTTDLEDYYIFTFTAPDEGNYTIKAQLYK
ncbi:hypothetical protein DRH14_03670, partial [Candidatus Shapirobacteria bacterium]